MNIEYTNVGDYYLPNLVAPENMKNFRLGKYGKLRLHYLKEHKKTEYTILLMENKLQQHLIDIDNQSNERFILLMKQFSKRENITEKLKEENQLEWVCKMNNIKNCAEEIIFKEFIYV